MSDELFYDVKAAEVVTNSLARPDEDQAAVAIARQGVSAVERGRRDLPDGTVETYQRIELK